MSLIFTDSFNTGSVASGADFNFNRAVSRNHIGICKIKVVPSVASALGYRFKLFKDVARTLELFATDDNKNGSFYYPTKRAGGEALEGSPIVYEDVDGTGQIHGQIHNFDSVSRSYDVQIKYIERDYPAFKQGNMTGSDQTVTTEQDLAGVTVSLDRLGVWAIDLQIDIDLNGTASIFLNFGGSNETQKIVIGSNVRGLATRTWIKTVTSNPTTAKARIVKDSGASLSALTTHTNMIARWLGEA